MAAGLSGRVVGDRWLWRQYSSGGPGGKWLPVRGKSEASVEQELRALRQVVEELQSQVAFQEDALQQLNAALAGQQQDILILRRQLKLLKERLDEQALGQDAPPIERPPHY